MAAGDLPPPPSLAAAEMVVERRLAMRDRIETQVSAIEEALEADAHSARALTALSSLVRQLRLAEDDLARAEYVAYAYRQSAPEDLTEEAYLAELIAAAEDMGEDHLRVFVDTWLRRHQLVAVAEDERLRERFPPARPTPPVEPEPEPPKRKRPKPARRSSRAGLIARTEGAT